LTIQLAETTSILWLIEARFSLQPLQSRDAKACYLLGGFNFSQKPREPVFG
jgi:phospholipase C